MNVVETLKLLLYTGKDVFIQEEEGRVAIRSIGDTVSVSCSIPGRAKHSIKVTKEKFSSIISSLPSYDKMVISGGKILLSNEESSRSFLAMPSDSFPELSLDHSKCLSEEEIDVSQFASRCASSLAFVKKGDDYFTGYVSVEDGKLFATDRFSMYAAAVHMKASLVIHPSQAKVLIAAKPVGSNAILRNYDSHWTIDGENFTIRFSKPNLGLTCPSFMLLLEKSKVLSPDLKITTKVITTDFDKLKDAMGSCYSIFVSEEYAYAIISSKGNGFMEVYAKSDASGGDEFISKFPCSEIDFRVKINPRLVEKAISALRDVKEMSCDSIGNLYFSCGKDKATLVSPMLEKKHEPISDN